MNGINEKKLNEIAPSALLDNTASITFQLSLKKKKIYSETTPAQTILPESHCVFETMRLLFFRAFIIKADFIYCEGTPAGLESNMGMSKKLAQHQLVY